MIGLDIETAKIPNHYPWKQGYYLSVLSISFPDNTTKSWVYNHNEAVPDLNRITQNNLEIQTAINQADIVAAHNAKFELNNLRQMFKFKRVFCTQVAEYLICYHKKDGGLSLNDVSKEYGLPPKIDKVKIMWEAGMNTHEVPLSTLIEYCEDDAYKARYIAEKQAVKLKQMGLDKCFELQMEWLNMLSAMETNGIIFDRQKAERYISKYTKYNQILERKIKTLVGPYVDNHDIKLSSNDELSVLLYGGTIVKRELKPVIKTKNIKVQMPYVFSYKNGVKAIKLKWKSHPDTKIIRWVLTDVPYKVKGLGIEPPKGKNSQTAKFTDDRPYWVTDKDTLPFLKTKTKIQKAVIKLLLKKSSIDKVVSTFYNEDKQTGLLAKLGTDNKLHTTYNQTVTATGRLSSSDPNSQNLPRKGTSPIKTCIVPEFDWIMNSDLSQIEWRVPAQLSQDSIMINEIKSGVDQHIAAAKDLMKLKFTNKSDPESNKNRHNAKIFNFRMIYGGTEYGFHKDPKMPRFGLEKWREIVKNFYVKYKGLHQWQVNNIQTVINGNGTLCLPTGRQFKFKLNPVTGKYEERQIKNYPVQGTAGGDILPLAAVIIWKAMKSAKMISKPILTVHDSIVFDVVDSEKDKLADLCMKVFNNLPRYIKQYWGINWLVPLTGEVELGKTYGQTKQIRG